MQHFARKSFLDERLAFIPFGARAILGNQGEVVSLDLAQITSQIEEMAASLRADQGGKRAKLEFTLGTLRSSAVDFEQINRKIEGSKATWLVAGLRERIDLCQPAPTCPEDFIVVASDGSHLDVDRHYSARCFVINIGLVQLQYGESPDAWLSSSPRLYFRDDEVVISSADGKQQPVEGRLLGVRRSVEECRALSERIGEIEADLPLVALIDGSLVLWELAGQSYPDFVVQELLVGVFLKHLEALRGLAWDKPRALASYISFPRSTEVVNVLRLAICPHDVVDCDRYCSGILQGRPCDAVGGLADRELFAALLDPGERSAIFRSRSSVVEKHYGVHEVNFFYVKLDDEIARVEIPLWVADDSRLLGLVHSVVLDQCRRGLGYPVALSEAHEKAVLTSVDRQQFWGLVEQILADSGTWLSKSAKAQSKRNRWI